MVELGGVEGMMVRDLGFFQRIDSYGDGVVYGGLKVKFSNLSNACLQLVIWAKRRV